MAASTIYSIQKMKSQNRFFQEIMNSYPHLQELVEENVQFLEKYYSPALELIPSKYRDYVKSRLEYFGLQFDDSSTLEHFQLYE